MTALVATRNGSTVHAGGYECEINGCHTERRHGGDGYPARWSIWRIGGQATWIACDVCEGQDDSGDGHDSRSLYLILPLLLPTDAYARIAVEEMLYALAALCLYVRERASRRFVLDVAPRHGKADQWWKSRQGR